MILVVHYSWKSHTNENFEGSVIARVYMCIAHVCVCLLLINRVYLMVAEVQ